MTSHLESVTMSDNASWTWNVMPLLAAAVAIGIVFFPQGNLQADDTVQATASEAATVATLLVPSPQPGMGEPELKAAELPQSY